MDDNTKQQNTAQTSGATKIVIELFSGCVTNVFADAPVDVVVLDFDVGEKAKCIAYGGEPQVAYHHFDADVDDDICQAVFTAVDEDENSPN